MRTLILGGSGFIGSHVVARLKQEDVPIIVFDRNTGGFPTKSGVTYVKGEFGNRGELQRLFSSAEITEVVHFVASTLPETSVLDPQFDVRTNLEQTISLLDLCVQHKVRKVLFMSSGGTVYGIPKYLPVDEKHPTDPITSYGITKLAIEKYLQLFQHLHGLSYVCIRAANPYGPGQSPLASQGAIPVFCYRMLRDEALDIWGDGSTVRDFFHVRDLVDLVVRALFSPATGVFNAGSGTGTSLASLIETLEQVLKRKALVRHLSGRLVDVPKIVLDCALAAQTFEWAPTLTLENGIRDTAEWIRKRWLAGNDTVIGNENLKC